MSDNEYRLLKANEIQCRPQVVKSYGFSLLLYKDARCDMAILDETYGRFNWQRKHSRENRNCTIEVWDADKSQWVGKEDVGTESYTEKEKGLASDSFKRAGFNWGIGRELYTSPFIWVEPRDGEINKDGNKYKLSDKAYFYVDEIEYNKDREVSKLVIKDKDDKVRFTHGTSNKTVKNETTNTTPKENSPKSSKEQPKESSETFQDPPNTSAGEVAKVNEKQQSKDVENTLDNFLEVVEKPDELITRWQQELDNADDPESLREEYYEKVFKKLESLS